LSAKVQQLTAERHKAVEGSRQLRSEIVALKESLEAATSQDSMPREEYKQSLRELQNSASSLSGEITRMMNESDQAYFSTLLPSSDVAQHWQDQDANYLLDPSDMPPQPLPGYPSSSLPTIPQLNPYPHLP
jgi:chromosome segregation ATPase